MKELAGTFDKRKVWVSKVETEEVVSGIRVPAGSYILRSRGEVDLDFRVIIPDEASRKILLTGDLGDEDAHQQKMDKFLADNKFVFGGKEYKVSSPMANRKNERRDILAAGHTEEEYMAYKEACDTYSGYRMRKGRLVKGWGGNTDRLVSAGFTEDAVNKIVVLAIRHYSIAEIITELRKASSSPNGITEKKVRRVIEFYHTKIAEGRKDFDLTKADVRLTNKRSRIEELASLYAGRREMYDKLLQDRDLVLRNIRYKQDYFANKIRQINEDFDDNQLVALYKSIFKRKIPEEIEVLRSDLVKYYNGQTETLMKSDKLVLKEAQAHLDNSYKACLTTLEAIRKEEEGDVLTVHNGNPFELEGAVEDQIKRMMLQSFGIGSIVLTRLCASRELDLMTLQGQLANSCYAKRLNTKGHSEEDQLYPSDENYDWGFISDGEFVEVTDDGEADSSTPGGKMFSVDD